MTIMVLNLMNPIRKCNLNNNYNLQMNILKITINLLNNNNNRINKLKQDNYHLLEHLYNNKHKKNTKKKFN